MLWSGRFSSSRYTFFVFPWVRGSIDVDLAENLCDSSTVLTTLQYDKVYRLGEGIPATLQATIVNDNYICGTYNTDLGDEGSFWLKPSN
jgi:hypothetical protein